MINLSVLFSMIISLNFQPEEGSLDWIVGTWAGIDNNETKQSFEIWEKLGKDNFEGIGYTTVNGDTVFMEKLAISNIYGVLYYIADVPENAEPTQFEIIKMTKTGFTCTNPEHDFPSKIEYTLNGTEMKATIFGKGKSKTFTFRKN